VTHWSDCAVYALKVLPNGSLIAGGDFTTAGSVSVNCIARWNGSTWSALGSGLNSAGDFASVRSITLPPGGELVVGGTFTHAGNLPSSRFARWTETGVPWVAQQPAGQSGDAGQTLTLTAKCASGYDFAGAVTFQWQRDGVDIANGASKDGGVVSGASGVLNAVTLSTTLTITGARPCDSGEYTVVLMNSCGSVTSAAALVDVSGGCAADLDGSGVVDGDDLALLLGSWGTSGGDLNGDVTTDSADLCETLAAWGACS
jgi:hypothetical protein